MQQTLVGFFGFEFSLSNLLSGDYETDWLPRETADAPSLEVFQVRLDQALHNLV